MFIRKTIALLVVLFLPLLSHGGELRVSAAEPILIVAPDHWQSSIFQPPENPLPYETFKIVPPADRNAALLISVVGKDKKQFTDPTFLKNLLRSGCLSYASAAELPKVPVTTLKIKDGLGYGASFVDPDLVGKPVAKGSFKTATLVILSLGSKYLLKVTIYCDETNGVDYQDAIKIVESIKIKND